MAVIVKRPKVSAKWRKLLALIPNYDCFRNADGYYFDVEAAQLAIDFFPECLQIVEGPKSGQPFTLEPWQQAVTACLFGWKNAVTGARRYKECLVFVPRKNGKTPWGAGMALFMLCSDKEKGKQIRSYASEANQARLVFGHAKSMVERDETLTDTVKVFQHSMELNLDSMSNYKYVSAKDTSSHGSNLHAGIVDELHVCTAELIKVIRTSMSGQSNIGRLVIYFTTSDFERPSICNETYDRAVMVRDGIIDDPGFLPVIYELTKADEDRDGPLFWTMEKNWFKANPNLGVSKDIEYMRRECAIAREMSVNENNFKRLDLNIRTEQIERWLPMDKWALCTTRTPEETPWQWRQRKLIELGGMRPYAALDLASILDLTALVLMFKTGERRFTVIPYFWAPRARAEERERKDKVPYVTWAQQGWMTLTDGDETDYSIVRRDIKNICSQFPFHPGEETGQPEVAVDTLFQGAETAQGLGAMGFEVVRFGQNMLDFAAPTKEFEELVNYGLLDHGNNPMLTWNAGNVCVYIDGPGNKKPSKKASGDKIDGIVASIMALGRAMVTAIAKVSVYETRGVLQF